VIKPPSQQNEFTLIFSGDPSLNVPPDDDGVGTDEEVNSAKRERLLRIARETGRWDDLIKAGDKPTLFDVKPLTGTAYDWLQGEAARRSLTMREYAALALRLALRDVKNFGEHKVRHETIDGHTLATTEIIDAIYAAAGSGHGALIVLELGLYMAHRAAESPSPK
jgi:hypothetical protein